MTDLHGFLRLWIAMVSVCTLAGWLIALNRVTRRVRAVPYRLPKTRLTSTRLPIFRSMTDVELSRATDVKCGSAGRDDPSGPGI